MDNNNLDMDQARLFARIYEEGLLDTLIFELEKLGDASGKWNSGFARDELVALRSSIRDVHVVADRQKGAYEDRLNDAIAHIEHRWDGDLSIVEYLERIHLLNDFIKDVVAQGRAGGDREHARSTLCSFREELEESSRIGGDRFRSLCMLLRIGMAQLDECSTEYAIYDDLA